MKTIRLTKGYVAKVDDEDFDRLSRWSWSAKISRSGNVYALTVRTTKKIQEHFQMHRVIIDCPDDMQVDHINGDTLDNRRENLRICTQAQNLWNRGKSRRNTSGYKGVFVNRVSANSGYPRYYAQIRVNGRKITRGMFDSPEDAARMYDVLARQHHGEFARTNFPIIEVEEQ